MKILIAIPCLLTGGTEIQTLNLITALVKLNYHVTTVCYFEYDSKICDLFEISGSKVVLLNYDRSITTLQFIQSFYTFLKQNQPDIFHVQYMSPGFLPIIAARLAGIKCIYATIHQTANEHGFIPKLLVRISSLITNKFICISLAAEKSWFGTSMLFDPENKASLLKKHITIYNSTDIEELETISNRSLKHYDYGKLIIGSVSRLRSEKGIDILIRAFAGLVKKYPNIELLIIGDGPDREKLENLALESGIVEKVTWKGFKPHYEAMEYMSIMDLVVIPSRQEGFGLTAIEAMSLGKPIVAARIGGLPEVIINGESGLLFHPEDEKSLSFELSKLINSEHLREKFSAEGKKRVRIHFSTEIFSQKIKHLYKNIKSEQ